MITQSLRASRQGATRLAWRHAASVRRSFVTTSVRQADMLQDMYLREVKNYKIPPVKQGDEKGHVHEFKSPPAPKSPEESDLANDLKSYESQQVEIEGQSDAGSSGKSAVEEWFEDDNFEAELNQLKEEEH